MLPQEAYLVHLKLRQALAVRRVALLTATCFSFAKMRVTVVAAWTWRCWLQRLPGVITIALIVTGIVVTLRLAPPAPTSYP